MSCDDYLSMLETLPVDELAYGRAREHADGCRDCSRVTHVVAERERNMLVAFGDLRPSVPAAQAAAAAIATARRRRVGLYYQIGLGLTAAAIGVYTFLASLDPVRPPETIVTETFRLQCLSPAQAGELLRPAMGRTGRVTMRASSPLGLITVVASREEMATAQALLERYDRPARSRCAVEIPVPEVPGPVSVRTGPAGR